jgi:Putative adhesin
MPTFTTPDPISATIDLFVGDVRITAADRADTLVEVLPTDESKTDDVRAVEQTKVGYADGRLVVKGPKRLSNRIGLGGRGPSVQIRIELPSGSSVHGSSAMGTFHCEGRLGDCEWSTGAGTLSVDEAGALRLTCGGGDITVGHVTGDGRATTGVGEVRIRRIGGSVAIKNSAGNTWVGEAGGEVRVRSASGDIVIDQAHADVDAKTSAGKIRIGEVSEGSVVMQSAAGLLEIGVREGTAAWLDVQAVAGNVHNLLDASDGPESADRTVEVRARTALGDILIRRASLAAQE